MFVANKMLPVQPSVAIVILNWNGRPFLEQFLPSVLASSYAAATVVVADNASTDGSVAFLRQRYPQVRIVENPTNEGFAKGYNTALQQVTADYYVLLNSDVEVEPDWIGPIVALMESDASIAACQPKIRAWREKGRFEYAGACGGWIDGLGYPFSRGRVFDVCEADTGQYDDAGPCFWASGCALFVKAAVYHQLGGLDPYFFAHQEEIDFCWRLQLAGYRVYVQPRSVVYHVGGGTLPMGNPRKVYLNFRNNLVMLAKNLPLADACWKLPLRLALDAVAAWKGLLGGKTGDFGAIAKAHGGFLKWLLGTKNKAAMPVRRKKVHTGVYSGSVVWQYFVKKRHTFLEIMGRK
jgi:GT2 family glycosyltransferase